MEKGTFGASLFCRDDFVEISNQNNFTFGKYCGIQTGRTVEVSGDYAIITFHSDLYGQTRGFSLLFTAVLPSVYTKCLSFNVLIKNMYIPQTDSLKLYPIGGLFCSRDLYIELQKNYACNGTLNDIHGLFITQGYHK